MIFCFEYLQLDKKSYDIVLSIYKYIYISGAP